MIRFIVWLWSVFKEVEHETPVVADECYDNHPDNYE